MQQNTIATSGVSSTTETPKLLRGEVAKRSGVGLETLRYYEKIGLISPCSRSASNYRQYTPDVLSRLRFIQSAKHLGFSLEEIGALLDLKQAQNEPCTEVREKASQKIVELDQKIDELQKIRADLAVLVEECDGISPIATCPILRSLAGSEGN